VADDKDVVPVSTVGALNPDTTTAMFSNDGPWVRYLRHGAALVSTFPTTFDAAQGPSYELRLPDGEVRSSLDPDDFSSGFGVWSGTSFAAPVFAGEVAAALAARYVAGDTGQDQKSAVRRMRTVLKERPTRGGRA
jgi:subtilisin family serine protease